VKKQKSDLQMWGQGKIKDKKKNTSDTIGSLELKDKMPELVRKGVESGGEGSKGIGDIGNLRDGGSTVT